MTGGNSQSSVSTPTVTAGDIFWAARCGIWGGLLVGLPVALATGIDYAQAAIGCGLGLFGAASAVLALRSIGGTVGTFLSRLVCGLLMAALLIGVLSFIGLKLYCEFGRPAISSTTQYDESFEPAIIGR